MASVEEDRETLADAIEGLTSESLRTAAQDFLDKQSVLAEVLPVGQKSGMVRIIKADLDLRQMTRVGVHNNIKMVYDIGGALRDARIGRGNPILIRLAEAVASVGGSTPFVGYTVPPNRQTRIDTASITFITVAQDQMTGLARFDRTIVGVFPLEAAVIQPLNVYSQGTFALPFRGPLFLDAGDRFSGIIDQRVLDAAATAGFTGFFTVSAIEVDRGYGWSDFA